MHLHVVSFRLSLVKQNRCHNVGVVWSLAKHVVGLTSHFLYVTRAHEYADPWYTIVHIQSNRAVRTVRLLWTMKIMIFEINWCRHSQQIFSSGVTISTIIYKFQCRAASLCSLSVIELEKLPAQEKLLCDPSSNRISAATAFSHAAEVLHSAVKLTQL